MAGSLESNQVRQEAINSLPGTLGDIYYHLYNQIVLAHSRWDDYRSLYVKDAETLNMLNRVAPAFCYSLQQLLWQDVLLSLCRLTDPITTGRGKSEKANLTILRVHPLVPDLELQRRVQQLAERAKLETEFARALRNRRLAHRELPPAPGQLAIPMPTATLLCVDTAFATIREAMNLVERRYLDKTVMYDRTIQALGGVDALIATLQIGEDFIKAERKKYGTI